MSGPAARVALTTPSFLTATERAEIDSNNAPVPSGPREQEARYLQDLLCDSASADTVVQPGNFSALWTVLQADFLRAVTESWIVTHGRFWKNNRKLQNSATAGDFYDKSFADSHEAWKASSMPTLPATLEANAFFAGLNATLQNELVYQHPGIVDKMKPVKLSSKPLSMWRRWRSAKSWTEWQQ